MSGTTLYAVAGVPDAPKEINLAELMKILGIVIKNDDIRAAMQADPAATLAKLNYVPNDKAVAFFNSLKSAEFDAAVAAFEPVDPDPAFGMAEL